MPDSTAYDPHSVDDMNREAERWHDTSWDSLIHKLDHATREQLLAMAKAAR